MIWRWGVLVVGVHLVKRNGMSHPEPNLTRQNRIAPTEIAQVRNSKAMRRV